MKKVACIVVTYNRLSDLQHCIEALRNQTYKDFDIIVVNNGSTDGTKDYLATQNDIVTINQDNLGSSGGQYAGQKYMMEHDYTWWWAMDDDGIPAPDQLMELVKYGELGHYALNALVIDKDTRDKFSFGYGPNNYDKVMKMKTIDGYISPFNGTFLHRSVIEKCGYIKKEMFIWGDEQEYICRLKSNGYIPQTVVAAKHYHPSEKGKKVKVFPPFINASFLDKPKRFSHYFFRNLGYIEQTYMYSHWYSGYRTYAYYTIYFLRTGQFRELVKFWKYYTKGRHNDYR